MYIKKKRKTNMINHIKERKNTTRIIFLFTYTSIKPPSYKTTLTLSLSLTISLSPCLFLTLENSSGFLRSIFTFSHSPPFTNWQNYFYFHGMVHLYQHRNLYLDTFSIRNFHQTNLINPLNY